MATPVIDDFEDVSDGVAVPTGVNGRTNVTAATGTTTSPLHGSRSVAVATGTVDYGSQPATMITSYLTKVTTEAAAGGISLGIKNGSTHLSRIRFNSTGHKIDITNAASAVQATSTTGWAVDDIFRLDVAHTYNAGAGTLGVVVEIFKGANADGWVPDETLTATFAVASTPNRIGVGMNTSSWVGVIDMVRRYADVAALPTPVAAVPESPAHPVRTMTGSGWAATGAATIHQALADASDSSYAESTSGGTQIVRLERVAPDVNELVIRADLPSGGSGALTVQLREGATTRQTWTPTIYAGGPIDIRLPFDEGTAASITDWDNLYVYLQWSA